MTGPVRRALTLAACTVLGLVGMLVLSGAGDWIMLALAAAPAAVAVGGYLARRRARG